MDSEPRRAEAVLQTVLTDEDEILAKLLAYSSSAYRHYVPLSDAVDSYSHWASTPNARLYMGIAELDERMRGTAPGEMTLIIGFSAGGKTLVATKMLQANPNRRIALFTPDETRDLILVKLACADHGVSAVDLEQRLERGDASGRELLVATANRYPNLAVYEEDLSLHDIDAALTELEERVWFGEPAEAVIYDYLDLLDGGDDARSKASAIKAWGKRRHVPLFVIHQASRTAGKDGTRPTLTAGAYGGEQQASFVVGVWRRKYEVMARIREVEEKLSNPATKNYVDLERVLEDLRYSLRVHQDTMSVNLLKSKRPGSQISDEGWDLELDVNTGRLTSLSEGDLPKAMRKPIEQMEAF